MATPFLLSLHKVSFCVGGSGGRGGRGVFKNKAFAKEKHWALETRQCQEGPKPRNGSRHKENARTSDLKADREDS